MARTDASVEEELKAREFIESREWYQTIRFDDGLESKGVPWCGDPCWDNIKKFLPPDLYLKSVLDLGCNAGIFCVRAAMAHASHVVGVDWAGWRPEWNFEEQRIFVKEYFERSVGYNLPITYISDRIENFVKDDWKFDYCIASACLYYTDHPVHVVENISRIANTVVTRLRDENRIKQFVDLFKENGYTQVKCLQEKWWEKLDQQTDDFYLYMFVKEPKDNIFWYRLVKGHDELAGKENMLHIWDLMTIARTEECGTGNDTFDKEHQRLLRSCQCIDEKYITRIPLKKFYRLQGGSPNLTSAMKEAYPWEKLVASVKKHGVVCPVVAEEQDDGGYEALEGRRRKVAALIAHGDEYLIPCVVVKRVF